MIVSFAFAVMLAFDIVDAKKAGIKWNTPEKYLGLADIEIPKPLTPLPASRFCRIL